MKDGFTFGAGRSDDYDVILTEAPPVVAAVREVEKATVPGRSGDLVYDRGHYRNVTIPYRCAIVSRRGISVRRMAITVVNTFRPGAAYEKLVNSFDPSHYRLARVVEEISVESIVERSGRFTLTFDCMPQRWRVDGDQRWRFDGATTIHNSTGQTALPMIMVYGSGSGTVTVGDTTVQILELEDRLTLDCSIQNAHRKSGGQTVNKNSCIYAPEFPKLEPGDNQISFDGGISYIEIIPKWWDL